MRKMGETNTRSPMATSFVEVNVPKTYKASKT
jgi:hypothetical protein